MTRILIFSMCLAFNCLCLPYPCEPVSTFPDDIHDAIKSRLGLFSEKNMICREEFLCGPGALSRFYKKRDYGPAWIENDGSTRRARDLIRKIRSAGQEGLNPSDYHLANIEKLLEAITFYKNNQQPLPQKMIVDFDLLLTDAFLLLGSHLLAGRVNPETIQPEWIIQRREADLVDILNTALGSNAVESALERLSPLHADYIGLKNALSRHREIMGAAGWPVVPDGPKLEKGDQGDRVKALRSRLSASGDLSPSGENVADIFDDALDPAVRRFQSRHGLKVDGIVGRNTLRALNVPLERRIRQIEANLERWRWLPQSLGHRYVLVNIADYDLTVVENNQAVVEMPVVVGRRYRSTPVFTQKMTYVELNPYWHVPRKLARNDVLPKIQEDPGYLADQNMRVFESWGKGAPEIDPETVDWSKITRESLRFKFRQDPGPVNALGRVKFMFPNKFSVYLHDTPAKELFKKIRRSFSSGCIRVEKPFDLLTYLFKDDPQWTKDRLSEGIDSGSNKIITIKNKIDVHLLYWTAWVGKEGIVHFREDIYRRDEKLIRALQQHAPKP
jgi:L,D-transpeptidase YcbB